MAQVYEKIPTPNSMASKIIKLYYLIIANVQNICNLIGCEEYYLGRVVPSLAILYSLTKKHHSRSSHPEMFLEKICSENMQQICRRTTMLKSDFNKVEKQSYFIGITLRHWCSPVNLLHIFRTSFTKEL